MKIKKGERFDTVVKSLKQEGFKVEIKTEKQHRRKWWSATVDLRVAKISGKYTYGKIYDSAQYNLVGCNKDWVRLTHISLKSSFSDRIWDRWWTTIDVGLPRTKSELKWLMSAIKDNCTRRYPEKRHIYYPRHTQVDFDRITLL